MSITRRTKRPRHSTRRIDTSSLKELLGLEGDMIFPCLGIVTDEDVDSHFSIEGTGDGTDLFIEVQLVPGDERMTARMGVAGAGAGQGIWFIPPVGTEVVLIICDGEIEAGAVIVGVLSTGSLPNGVAAGTTVITNSSKVLIHNGNGTTDQLVLKTAYAAHVHPSGTGPTGVPDNALASSSYTQTLEGG